MRPLCPFCRAPLEARWTWWGVLKAVLCFPCGLWCCPAPKNMHCAKCNLNVSHQEPCPPARVFFQVVESDGGVPRQVQNYKYYQDYYTKPAGGRNSVRHGSTETASTNLASNV